MSDENLNPDGSDSDLSGEKSLLGGGEDKGSGGKGNPADDGRSKVERLFRKDFTDANPEIFNGIENVTDLVSGLLEQRKNAVFRDGMSPDEMAAYRKLHGIPEKAEDYPFSTLDMFDQPGAQKIAHEAGLTRTQAKALEKWAHQRENERAQRIESEKSSMQREARTWLETTYGQNAKSQLLRAEAVLANLADEKFINELHLSGISNSKHFIGMLLKFADAVSESPGTNAGGEPGPSKSTNAANDDGEFAKVIFPEV